MGFWTLFLFGAVLQTLSVSTGFDRENSSSTCDSSEFPCDDGQCISKNAWCDSVKDCIDKSDERFCSTSLWSKDPNKCREHHFRCNKGPCIPLVGRCDGVNSCSDNSDEDNCTDPSNESLASYETPSTDAPVLTSAQTSTAGSSQMIAAPLVYLDSESTTFNINRAKYGDILELARRNAEKWLLSQQKEDSGWGDETPRAVVALYLSNSSYFQAKTMPTLLMAKQLQLELSIDLIKNQSKAMALGLLSLYVNALLATCNNPRNFHGQDLVETLRQRTDSAQKSGEFVNPSVYLTLCIAGSTTFTDVRKVEEFIFTRNVQYLRLDMQALAVLAAACIQDTPEGRQVSIKREGIQRLLQRMAINGLLGNVYTESLVAQALASAGLDDSHWKQEETIRFLLGQQKPDGSFGDILSTYYALPTLSGHALGSLKDFACYNQSENGLTSLEVLKNSKRNRIYVQYSLYHGNPVEVSHTMQLKIAENTNFFDIMRLAEENNVIYSFKYEETRGSVVVYSIGDIPNDAEQGKFWMLHANSQKTAQANVGDTSSNYTFRGDMKKLYPLNGDHLIFWFKSLSN